MASRPSRRSSGGTSGRPRARWERAARLVRKADFDAVYHCGERRDRDNVPRRGGRLKSTQFVVFYCATGGPCSRFGVSVKKALGSAVVRNRIRRRIREILRRNLSEIPSGWDFVMHPRRSVAVSDFAALENELVGLLRNIPQPAQPAATQPAH